MNLHKKMVESGHTIFRYRSYFPLLFIAPLLLALRESAHANDIMGESLSHIWTFTCFFISFLGLFIRAATVGFVPAGTSGRNTQEQRANHLNTKGMYSIVRNPLYLGNFIMILGVVLSIKVWWLAIIFPLGFFIYMERIILTEEDFLIKEFGQPYKEWCAKTPVILPNFKLWEAPDMKLSVKTILRREYPGFIALGVAFFMTELMVDILVDHEPLNEWLSEDRAWSMVFLITLVIGLSLRFLKKHTDVLKVEGR